MKPNKKSEVIAELDPSRFRVCGYWALIKRVMPKQAERTDGIVVLNHLDAAPLGILIGIGDKPFKDAWGLAPGDLVAYENRAYVQRRFQWNNETFEVINSADICVVNNYPLGDRILVKQEEQGQDKTKGGLYLPEASVEAPKEGEVIVCGPGTMDDDQEPGTDAPEALSVIPGDHVAYGKYAGQVMVIDGQRLVLMHEEDVLGVIAKETANV